VVERTQVAKTFNDCTYKQKQLTKDEEGIQYDWNSRKGNNENANRYIPYQASSLALSAVHHHKIQKI